MAAQVVEILDPVGDVRAKTFQFVPRPTDLRGMELGVLDTQWKGFTSYLEQLVPLLEKQFQVSRVVKRQGVVAHPANEKVLDELARTTVVLNGLCN